MKEIRRFEVEADRHSKDGERKPQVDKKGADVEGGRKAGGLVTEEV